jgi:hypothetical protein
MTPKEKAWQLWNFYGTLLGRYDKASDAALQVVYEIKQFMKNDDYDSNTCYWANHKLLIFWIDVETELKKLK